MWEHCRLENGHGTYLQAAMLAASFGVNDTGINQYNPSKQDPSDAAPALAITRGE